MCSLRNLRKPQGNKSFLEIEISLLSCQISKTTMFWKNCIHFFDFWLSSRILFTLFTFLCGSIRLVRNPIQSTQDPTSNPHPYASGATLAPASVCTCVCVCDTCPLTHTHSHTVWALSHGEGVGAAACGERDVGDIGCSNGLIHR